MKTLRRDGVAGCKSVVFRNEPIMKALWSSAQLDEQYYGDERIGGVGLGPEMQHVMRSDGFWEHVDLNDPDTQGFFLVQMIQRIVLGSSDGTNNKTMLYFEFDGRMLEKVLACKPDRTLRKVVEAC
jgi:hypothetical protein